MAEIVFGIFAACVLGLAAYVVIKRPELVDRYGETEAGFVGEGENRKRLMNAVTLGAALREAAKEHHEYEQKLGHPDENWADWYAQYIVDNFGDGYVV